MVNRRGIILIFLFIIFFIFWLIFRFGKNSVLNEGFSNPSGYYLVSWSKPAPSGDWDMDVLNYNIYVLEGTSSNSCTVPSGKPTTVVSANNGTPGNYSWQFGDGDWGKTYSILVQPFMPNTKYTGDVACTTAQPFNAPTSLQIIGASWNGSGAIPGPGEFLNNYYLECTSNKSVSELKDLMKNVNTIVSVKDVKGNQKFNLPNKCFLVDPSNYSVNQVGTKTVIGYNDCEKNVDGNCWNSPGPTWGCTPNEYTQWRQNSMISPGDIITWTLTCSSGGNPINFNTQPNGNQVNQPTIKTNGDLDDILKQNPGKTQNYYVCNGWQTVWLNIGNNAWAFSSPSVVQYAQSQHGAKINTINCENACKDFTTAFYTTTVNGTNQIGAPTKLTISSFIKNPTDAQSDISFSLPTSRKKKHGGGGCTIL